MTIMCKNTSEYPPCGRISDALADICQIRRGYPPSGYIRVYPPRWIIHQADGGPGADSHPFQACSEKSTNFSVGFNLASGKFLQTRFGFYFSDPPQNAKLKPTLKKDSG